MRSPEKETHLLPLFAELCLLLPHLELHITMVGPAVDPCGEAGRPTVLTARDAVGGHCEDESHDGVACDDVPRGTVHVRAIRGTYREFLARGGAPPADLVVALNAGLASYAAWRPTTALLLRARVPFIFTDYSENGVELALRDCLLGAASDWSGSNSDAIPAGIKGVSGDSTDLPTSLNPFRQPLRWPLLNEGKMRLPWMSNGFIAGFHLPKARMSPPRGSAAPRLEPTCQLQPSMPQRQHLSTGRTRLVTRFQVQRPTRA